MPKGVVINSVARGEKRDGVLGTSCMARSINAEGGRGCDSCGKLRGLCSGMVMSMARWRKGKGRDAARLTVLVVGVFAGVGGPLVGNCRFDSSLGKSGTGGRALLSLNGFEKFFDADRDRLGAGASVLAVLSFVSAVAAFASGTAGATGPSGEGANQSGSAARPPFR